MSAAWDQRSSGSSTLAAGLTLLLALGVLLAGEPRDPRELVLDAWTGHRAAQFALAYYGAMLLWTLGTLALGWRRTRRSKRLR